VSYYQKAKEKEKKGERKELIITHAFIIVQE
jgi:hypothetical protein